MEERPKNNFEEEIQDLKRELENFQQEKERIRQIIGKIGGVPESSAKIMNVVFIAILLISVIVSVIAHEKWQLIMIELAMVTLSIKIIYLIHSQNRVNHFKFWILSSIEWRINELMTLIKKQKNNS